MFVITENITKHSVFGLSQELHMVLRVLMTNAAIFRTGGQTVVSVPTSYCTALQTSIQYALVKNF